MQVAFIGSTQQDLRDYRQAAREVCERARLSAIGMESFATRDAPAKEACRAELAKAHVYIGIYAHRYGYIPEGDQKSITEWEFEWAHELGMDRLCFVVNPNSPWPPNYIDHENRELLRAFKERIDRSLIRGTFDSVGSFRELLTDALWTWKTAHPPAMPEGFDALASLTNEPVFRNAAASFRYQLAHTAETLKTLNTYKLVHDELQLLQFECYEPMVAEARLPWDSITIAGLERYRLRLGDSLARLEQALSRIPVEPMWLSRLQRADRLLEESIRLGDPAARNEAAEHLKGVLDLQLSLVNTRLNALAGTLDLARVSAVLSDVAKAIAEPGLDVGMADRLSSSVQCLIDLQQRFQSLVREHDNWQALDNEMRRVGNTLVGGDTGELDRSWRELDEMSRRLEAGVASQFSPMFLIAREKVERAIAAKSPSGIKPAFVTFHQFASRLFHKVDAMLKTLCEESLEGIASLVGNLDMETRHAGY
jgi:hypothetical protein